MQQLCNEIQSEHVRTYLLSNDWRVAESQHADALFFEKDSDDDQPYRIWIWASRERPKFASRIQNLLFSLSVIESREPLEIGNAILDCVAPVSASVAPQTSVMRISIRNVYDHKVECHVEASAAGGHELWPDESIDLVFTSEHQAPSEIRIGSQRVDVRCREAESVRVYQGQADDLRACSATQIVREELQRGGITDENVETLLSELAAPLKRADFDLAMEDDRSSIGPLVVRRQAAIVATALAKRLPDSGHASRIVWFTAARIAAIANLRLELTGKSIVELFSRALEDDELAPAATSAYLKEISKDFSPAQR